MTSTYSAPTEKVEKVDSQLQETAEKYVPPQLLDLTIDNITENVKLINNQTPNPRLKFVLEKLVDHLHDLARETKLTEEEWMTTLLFLTKVGQKCSDVRQEFILLSDVLGLSLLVDGLNNPKPENATESTVLGPFHAEDARHKENGGSIFSKGAGDLCLAKFTLKDTKGQPIEGCEVDIWETDETGHYDTQYDDRNGPDFRGILTSDKNGDFWFKSIVPVSYPIPNDGPVGDLLKHLKRHPYRPAHMHFMFTHKDFRPLVTALYIKGDSYETTDAVFGVKSSLIVELQKCDAGLAKNFDVPEDTWLLTYDFVLTTEEENRKLMEKDSETAKEASSKL